MTRPPVGLIGFASGRTTFWSGVSVASRACSPIVRPEIVIASACRCPPSSSRFATSGMPPARWRSVATNRPPGLRSASSGTRALTRLKSSMSSGTPRFVGDREQVQHGVGRAAGGRDGGDGVLERVARDDLTRPHAAPQHVHHHARRRAAPTPTLSSSVAGTLALPNGEMPRHLAHGGHRVGGELAAAGAGARAGLPLERVEVRRAHACRRRGRRPLRRRPGW